MKAQIHISFSVIFSVLLIAVFLFVAVYAINHFMKIKCKATVGLFYTELQEAINELWRVGGAFTFSGSLPVKYVCFANLSSKENFDGLDAREKEIAKELYDEISKYAGQKNVFLLPKKAACGLPSYSLKYLRLPKTNPVCFAVEGEKVRIRLEREEEALVRLGKGVYE